MLATAYETASEAIHNKSKGEWVVSVKGFEGFIIVSTEQSDRMEMAGQITAFWMLHSSGRIVSVPVGDE